MLSDHQVRTILQNLEAALAGEQDAAARRQMYFQDTQIFHDLEMDGRTAEVAATGMARLLQKYRIQ